MVNFTPEQKAKIKEMIANASSPAEIERIEECVKRGDFPGDEDTNGNGNGKRAHEEEDENGDGNGVKRSRTSVAKQ